MRSVLLRAAALITAGGAGLAFAQAPVKALMLTEVLQSVEQSYPSLLAAFQERNIAAGKNLSAQGEFDAKLKAKSLFDPIGTYVNRSYDFQVEQPSTLWGTTFFGGYRLGRGVFAPYDGKLETRTDGEFRGGMRIPLFRDGSIDQRRADIRITGIDRKIAELSVSQQKIALIRAASRRYWDWVAAGRRYAITKDLLNLAVQRNDQLEETVKQGQIPPIELTDNRRAILQRQGELVSAERFVQQTAIELSLYYRDAGGNPVLPAVEQLPPAILEPSPVSLKRMDDDIAQALQLRPEIEALTAERAQSEVEIRLQRNQLAPAVDFVTYFARDVGRVPRGKLAVNEYEAGLNFDFPVQRRKARGKLQVAQAKITQIDLKQRLARDRVSADVRDAYSALAAAFQRIGVARNEVDVARQLEDAERTRFELGDTTLFVVNLRELATADAAIREITAVADYHRFFADYRAAIADAIR